MTKNKNNVTLLFAGDFLPPENTKNLYSDELLEVLKEKDFSIVNLETPLTNYNNPIKKTGTLIKRPPSSINHLKEGFFDAVALSNNHIRDYGDAGVMDTISECKKVGISTVGAGSNLDEASKPLKINIKGKNISFLNFSEKEFNIADTDSAGANPFDIISVYYQIQEERRNTDILIVIYHGGVEFHNYPLQDIKKTFRYLIDLGADTVISHHTHYIGGFEVYKNKPIFYSLGNFYFKYKSKNLVNNEQLNRGLVVKLVFGNSSEVGFNIYGVKKTKEQKTLLLFNQADNHRLLKEIELMNTVIKSDNMLESYWVKQAIKYQSKYFSLIYFTNPLLVKFAKKINISVLRSPYWKRNVSNIIRCFSHRKLLELTLRSK